MILNLGRLRVMNTLSGGGNSVYIGAFLLWKEDYYKMKEFALKWNVYSKRK